MNEKEKVLREIISASEMEVDWIVRKSVCFVRCIFVSWCVPYQS